MPPPFSPLQDSAVCNAPLAIDSRITLAFGWSSGFAVPSNDQYLASVPSVLGLRMSCVRRVPACVFRWCAMGVITPCLFCDSHAKQQISLLAVRPAGCESIG